MIRRRSSKKTRVETKRCDPLHRVKRWWILPLLFASSFSISFGQTSDPVLSLVNKKRFKAVVIGTGLAYTTSMIGFSQGWYSQYPHHSFHRTYLARLSPGTVGSGLSEVLKDYNGQTYWLSLDVDKFIPFPKWLNISAGYGADNMIHAHDSQNRTAGYVPYRQYYLGLDFDLTAFKSKSKVVNTLIYFVNLIRLPAPALEFSQGKVKGHFLYF